MDGSQVGEFRIISKLGAGAMGAVYLAERNGARVALKILHSRLLERHGFLHRFEREATIGLAVDDPHVVRVLDYELLMPEEGDPHCLLVMEYVEGQTLRELLAELGQVPEALLREIGVQIATGLAAIHDEGIIHRDIKPENVLISADHRVRIMDLGVAKSLDDSLSLTREGHFAGTLPYASPEQLSGREVGPASDLYSLGVVLYELATGTNPFRREDAPSSIAAQLNEVPPPATDRNPEISDFLTALLECLLAKTVAERFASAAVLAETLEGGERTEWWAQRSLSGRASRRPRIPVRRETRLLGREAQLEQLSASWSEAQAGTGAVVLVEGEAGIGKSRLIDAFLDGIEESAEVLYGSYAPSGGHGGLSDAVTGRFGEAGLTARLAPHLTVTPSLVPGFVALLRGEAPPDGAASLTSCAVHTVFCHLARGLAEESPMMWVVEDLHFASEDSREVVLSLARVVAGRRILLLLTTRAGVSEVELEQLRRLDEFRRVSLGRLSPREVVDLLRDALKSEALAEKLGGKVAHKSDGIPFIIFEILRGLRDGQFLTELPDGTWIESKVVEKIEIPSAVRDLLEVRLSDLSDDDRQILDVAAVNGYVFDPDLVARVLGRKRVEILQRLAVIERRRGIVRGGGSAPRFDHHLIQEVVYGDLMTGLRVEYHTLLAGAHADRLQGEPAGEDAVFLAAHYLRGSEPVKGLPHLTPALEQLERSHQNEACIELALRALESPGLLKGRERAEVLLKKAGRHDLRGERVVEREALDEALALADADGNAALRAKVRLSLSKHLAQIWNLPGAKKCLHDALGLARTAKETRIEAAVLGGLAIVSRRQGHHEEAREQCEMNLALAGEIEDRRVEARAAGNLGLVLLDKNCYEEARAHMENQLALSGARGDLPGEATARGNLANVFLDQGRYEEAEAQYERKLALSIEIGDRAGEASATGNLGIVFYSQGLYAKARQQYEKHLALCREIRDRRGEAQAKGNLGLVFLEQGFYAEARAHTESHLALSREIGSVRSETIARGNLGNLLLRQGRYEEARAQIRQHLGLSRELGYPLGETIATGNLGCCFLRCGLFEEAWAHLTDHLALAREIGHRREEGYALAYLGSLAEAEGDAETALLRHGEALSVRRNLGEKALVADTLVALAGIEGEREGQESAIIRIEEALVLAREVTAPEASLLGHVYRARLPGGDVDTALAALEEHENRVPHEAKMNARLRLWDLTGDRVHLVEAHCLLCSVLDHAPDEYRESMIKNVPLLRDLTAAWEERGGGKA